MKAFCPNSWTYSGIEIDTRAVEKARDKGYKILQGDLELENLTELKGQIDLLLMHQVLEHTRSPLTVINKVKKIIKDEGVISIETPDTDSWDRRIFYKRYWGGYHFPRHFYLFNKKTIRQLLEKTGFEIISIKSLPSPVFWIHSVHNYLIEHNMRIAKYFHYQNPLLLAIATIIEIAQIGLAGKSSNMQILAKKVRED
jgi:SAM-dependent methyltransferase